MKGQLKSLYASTVQEFYIPLSWSGMIGVTLGGQVLLLSTVKLNSYLGRGTIPQKGCFVE